MINSQVEEKVCGDGPCLEDVFEDDTHLHEINNKIQVYKTPERSNLGNMCVLIHVQECVTVAFQKADDYRKKFEPYRDFHQENEALDVDKLREEDHG